MKFAPVDRVPNHEVGVWAQTKPRWREEGLPVDELHWDWFVGEERWEMDPREYLPVRFDMIPPFEKKVLKREGDTEIVQHANGVVTRALVTGQTDGMRASMDQYLRFPIETPEDFQALKKRLIATNPARYPPYWKSIHAPRWNAREHVLVMSENCGTLGFFWRAREWMGTEGVSYGWYDEPEMMHEMMEFIADFTIETAKPMLEEVTPDYIFLNEDMSMKTGPLLSPDTYRTFILPHMKRLVAFFKDAGVPWFAVDTDGNPDLLLPMLIDAGVDAIWPLERAADMDPLALRKKYGHDLCLWGGVDKRILSTTPEAIDAHLRTMQPLIEDGGFIPTVDHLVPPDISLPNFEHYMARKRQLLRGERF